MTDRPFITLDATRNEAGAVFIRVAMFGFELAHYARDEEDAAFAYVYGFARAAVLAGRPEPLACWNLDWAALDACPDYVGPSHAIDVDAQAWIAEPAYVGS